MSKTVVYCFENFSIHQGQTVVSNYMATLEAIKSFDAIPLMDTAKEVDASELDENGRYPKTLKVIYSTMTFPLTDQQFGKQTVREFPSLEAVMSAPFPMDDHYIFASLQVANGWYTRLADKPEWMFNQNI
jgi:hypothetical protein